MKKTITITLETDFLLGSPTYKQTKCNVTVEGMQNLEVVQVVSNVLTQKVNELSGEVIRLQNSLAASVKGNA